MKKNLTQTFLFLLCSVVIKAQTPQLGKSSIKDVIAAMTLEEKAKLVVGNGFSMPGAKPNGPVVGVTQDKVPGAAGTTFAIPRLGVPLRGNQGWKAVTQLQMF